MQPGPPASGPVDNLVQPPIGGLPPKKKKGLPWWAILLIIGALIVPACGVLASVAVYGVRKYVKNAKYVEARRFLPGFAAGIASCAKSSGKLPQSSAQVPSSLSSVAGKKYQSSRGEWAADATLECSGFSMSEPQYFQYRWVLEGPKQGHVAAVCDLDGDGAADGEFKLEVTCVSEGECSASGPVLGP